MKRDKLSHDTPEDRPGNCSNDAPVMTSKVPSAAQRTVLAVPEMCCGAESAAIEKALKTLDGVVAVQADMLRHEVAVEHDGVSPDTLLGAARRTGMDVRALPMEVPMDSATSTLFIEKMDCPTEEALIRKRLGDGSSGVTGLSFNLLERTLVVEHEPGALPQVLSALQQIGLPGTAKDSPAAGQSSGQASWLSSHWKLMAGGVTAAAAEAFALTVGDSSPAVVVLALIAIALTGVDTYRKGWISIRHGSLNINALMSIAVTGAVLIGQWPEAAMVMFLFAVAEAIEARSLQRARRAVESLMAVAPETATVRTNGVWTTVPASAVAVGTCVRLRPGERVAVDGRITVGATSVNQAPITGESLPVDKGLGDMVLAGTINQDGEIEYETTATATNSTLARIVRAVQEAQATRAPTQRFVDRFAAYYTPAVLVVAVAVALIPPLLLAADWFPWVYRALVLLVVACPCALVISTPVTVVSGLTAAARRGILIKGGLFLEGGDKLEVLALDKTGTLTLGKPMVTDVVPLNGYTREQLLSLGGALSSRSDHPVSMAIADYARDSVGADAVSGFAALRGRGIEALIDGKQYRLGNHRLLKESGAQTAELEQRLEALEKEGKTAVVLVTDAKALGIFAIADRVRSESAEAVEQLKQLGIRSVMLTGDNTHTARAVALAVGIAEVRSELLPEEKLAAIAELQAGGASVGMVGDGINDAPALAKADIGFAMGAAGTDTAIETADVALMDDDPRKLAAFVRLSRNTKSVLWQNIILALGIKAVFLVLTISGHATLWMAVFADVGASLIVVFNGMRLLRKRF